MFEKVLIAEDHETINLSLQKTLGDLGIKLDTTDYVYYCDHALNRIKKALHEGKPYELLITDLSFDDDHTTQEITNGRALIKAVKEIQPNLKVLIFSIENRWSVAQALMNELHVDAYVPKARHDAQDLKLAIEAIDRNKKFISDRLKKDISIERHHDFTGFDRTIISLLSQGTKQKEIPDYLLENNIKPSSLSSVEKRLNIIKDALGFSNNEQLVAYCKDKKII
ncbi:response regulator [Pedobacter sp.]|uniref:response regulator n=1 Tax=Pedobacter sp. TaxID=1411316 RepID=UPI0031D4AE2A